MMVRIQVIKVYDIEIPDSCDDPFAFAYGLQTTEIERQGRLVDVQSEAAEVVQDF